MHQTDLETLKAIASGDQAALAQLYDCFAPRILSLLLRWLGSRAEAEDVLQEVFWQVWRQAERYDPARSSPLGWLFLLARSRASDVLRRRRHDVSAVAHPEPESNVDPLERLQNQESNVQLHEALAGLTVEESTAIRLAFFGGLTYEHVAVHQAIPVGTAKTRIRRGIRRLRERLRVGGEGRVDE